MEGTAQVRDFYDRYPFPGKLGAYGDWRGQALGLLPILGLEPGDLEGKRVLDAGCGTGEYARSLASLGAEVTAIDISSGALELAQEIDSGLPLPSPVHYQQCSLFDFEPGTGFDVVLSLGVLHHMPDPHAGFERLVTCARPGGIVGVGLYSSVSRIHISALRRLLLFAARNDTERAIDLAQKWARPVLPWFIGRDNVDDRQRVADLLAHPLEHPVSLNTALQWYRRAGVKVTGSNPSHRLDDYGGLGRLPIPKSGRTASLLIQLRWLLWNADYYVVAGRRRS